MPKERLYRDEEINAVLKRAAEIHHIENQQDAWGLTIEELEQVAVETGIDPGAVRAAAHELELRKPDKGYHFLGAPTSIALERFVDADVTTSQWDSAVAELRRIYRARGHEDYAGVDREWVLREWGSERARASLIPEEDGSRLRVTHEHADYAWAFYGGIASTAIPLILLEFLFLPVGLFWKFAIALLVLVTVHAVASTSFRLYARSKERKTQDALDRVGAILDSDRSRERNRDSAAPHEVGSQTDRLIDGLPEPDSTDSDESHAREVRARPRT